MKCFAVSLVASLALFSTSAFADSASAWDEIRAELYGEREISSAEDVVTLTAPYRAKDDREVPIAATARFADGRTVKSVSIIIDGNPMPVSAVFDLETPEQSFAVTANMRINGPTPVRVVVEANNGELYMTEDFVKTSGLGACAAPPITGIKAAMATLGNMTLEPRITAEAEPESIVASLTKAPISSSSSSRAEPKNVRLEIKHPSHSGMQMDQITLLYILARYVETVEIWTDEDKLFTMTGSISLSEDPEIEFSYSNPDVQEIRVRMTDTEETVSEEVFPLGES